jgi:hypothetical protein
VEHGSGPEGSGRGEPSVRDLFRRAVARSDASAMRTGIERIRGRAAMREMQEAKSYEAPAWRSAWVEPID